MMKILKLTTIIFPLLILLIGLKAFQQHNNTISDIGENKTLKKIKTVIQSDTITVLKFGSNMYQDSTSIIPQTSYIVFNPNGKITTIVFKPKKNKWEQFTLEFLSTKESKDLIEYNLDDDVCRKVSIDINPYNKIAISCMNQILVFSGLKEISIEQLESLNLKY